MLLGGTACGPMPGYQMPHEETPDEAPQAPRGPPAPARIERPTRGATEVPSIDAPEVDGNWDTPEEVDQVEEVEEPADEPEQPLPKPPRYKPERNWEPEPRAPEPVRAPEPEPEPVKTDGIKIVRLDADSYYLIDSVRKLCFLRHKESMTSIDCAKIPEANDTGRSPGADEGPRARAGGGARADA